MPGVARRVMLGRVYVVSRTGHIVAELADPGLRVRLGAKVVDASGRIVGRLADLIGSVERPYAVVKPSMEAEPPGPGSPLFIIVKPRKQRGRRGGSGRRLQEKERREKGGRPRKPATGEARASGRGRSGRGQRKKWGGGKRRGGRAPRRERP